MIWVYIALIIMAVGGVFIYLIHRGKIVFTSGSAGEFGGRKDVKIVKRTHRSMTVPIDRSKGAGGSLDELPPEVRAQFEEMMATGETSSEKITVNIDGEKHEYSSIDEMPEDLRVRFEEERGKMSGEGDEIILTVDGRTYRYNSIDEVPPEWRIFLRGKG